MTFKASKHDDGRGGDDDGTVTGWIFLTLTNKDDNDDSLKVTWRQRNRESSTWREGTLYMVRYSGSQRALCVFTLLSRGQGGKQGQGWKG